MQNKINKFLINFLARSSYECVHKGKVVLLIHVRTLVAREIYGLLQRLLLNVKPNLRGVFLS